MAIFSASYTYSYWQGSVLGNSISANNEILIGEWGDFKRIIRVHSNLSQTFADFDIEIERDTSLGDDFADHFKFESLDPLPKDHPGVDLSLYTFDNWYLPNGTVFTQNTVVSNNIDVYPSWDISSSQFTYDLKSGMYNIDNANTFNLVGDLYIPGWRYKGREINMLCSYSHKFGAYDFGGALTIGAGIKTVYANGFTGGTATSLTLEEGLLEIPKTSFNNFHTSGDLILPSTIKSVGQQAMQGATFDGQLDLSKATELLTINSHAFAGIGFTGSLIIPSKVISIGNSAFTGTNFDDVLDLRGADSLETVGTSTFSGLNFKTLLMPINGSLKVIGSKSFQGIKLDLNPLYIPSTVEVIDSQAFSSTKVSDIYIPISVTEIGGSAFYSSTTATIYYEGSSIPSGWVSTWNYHNRTVVFNAIF